MSQQRSLQQLRSSILSSKEKAIRAINSQLENTNVKDGSFILGRYNDSVNDMVRTIIGVKAVNGTTDYSISIFDFDSIEFAAYASKVRVLEDTLGISEDGSTVTGQTIIDRVDTLEDLVSKLNGDSSTEGSVSKAVSDAKSELLGDAANEYNTLGKLEDAIQAVASDAKSYSIVKVTENLASNVREAWKLVDEDGVQAGTTINIYKDSALQDATLGKATVDGVEQDCLILTYLDVNGSTQVVNIPLGSFLKETEFKDGLQVSSNGEVSVKLDVTTEGFLVVTENGIKVSGVQDAINAAVDSVNFTDTATVGYYVSKVDQEKGTVKVTREALPTVDTISSEGKAIVSVSQSFGTIAAETGSISAQYVNISDTSEKFEKTTLEDVLLEIYTNYTTADSNEKTERENADKLLENNITNSVSTLNQSITDETAQRKANDTTLQSNIDAEAAERTSADSKLDERLKIVESAIGEGGSVEEQIDTAIENLVGIPQNETINSDYDTIYEIAKELEKLEGDKGTEGSIAYDIDQVQKSAVTKLTQSGDTERLVLTESIDDNTGGKSYNIELSTIFDCGQFDYTEQINE